MKIKSVKWVTLAPIFTLAVVTACANPCAAKNQNTSKQSETELISDRTNPCAAKNKNAQITPLAEELQGKPVVVDIYATWCSACKNIAPTLDRLKQEYEGKASFIVFDVSNKTSTDRSLSEARELGLENFFKQNKSKTALVAIIDPATGEILTKEYKNANLEDYTSVLNSALAK